MIIYLFVIMLFIVICINRNKIIEKIIDRDKIIYRNLNGLSDICTRYFGLNLNNLVFKNLSGKTVLVFPKANTSFDILDDPLKYELKYPTAIDKINEDIIDLQTPKNIAVIFTGRSVPFIDHKLLISMNIHNVDYYFAGEDKDFNDDLINLYKPVSIYKEKFHINKSNRHSDMVTNSNPIWWGHVLIKMLYFTKVAMINIIESKKNYDVILKFRPDLILKENIVLWPKTIYNNTYYTGACFFTGAVVTGDDKYFFGSYEIMKRCCLNYDNINVIYNKSLIGSPEIFFTNYAYQVCDKVCIDLNNIIHTITKTNQKEVFLLPHRKLFLDDIK